MKENSYLYMHYYEDTVDRGYVFAWFYKNCQDKAFYIYTKPEINIKDVFPEEFLEYIYEIFWNEEAILLEDMTEKGKKGYIQTLCDLGLGYDYRLYKMYSKKLVLESLCKGE